MNPTPKLLVAISLLLAVGFADAADSLSFAEPEIHLWANGAPGSEGKTSPETWNPSTDGFHRVTNINNPSITAFLAPEATANGTAVVVCPGGGHQYLVMDLEGSLVAKRLNEMGISAFVLKSRLARAPDSTYSVEGHSLRDAQRALRVIRSRAAEWGINPERVGIMGFSAGANLAALASTRFDDVELKPSDPVDSFSSRPDFAVPIYGGIPAEDAAISAHTPPTFLVAASDDRPAANMARYYAKLREQNIPAELHIYLEGGHGFGMTGRNPAFRELSLSHWPEQLELWLQATGFAGPE